MYLCTHTCTHVRRKGICTYYVYLHVFVASGSRKRPRSSQEDEGAPGLKQREALSDQSNIANDIGPDPVVIKRHYAMKKKTSGQADKVRTYVHTHMYIMCT